MLITLIVCLTIINLVKGWKMDEGSWRLLFERNR